MKASNHLWKDRLAGQIAPDLGREIDVFENEIALKKKGSIEDKVFAETRLRRGAYGQRYDNGLATTTASKAGNSPTRMRPSPRVLAPCGTPPACSVSRSRSAA